MVPLHQYSHKIPVAIPAPPPIAGGNFQIYLHHNEYIFKPTIRMGTCARPRHTHFIPATILLIITPNNLQVLQLQNKIINNVSI